MKIKSLIVVLFILSIDLNAQSIKKYNGIFGENELRHLLRRTMFGATQDDLKFFKGKSMDEVVSTLLETNPIVKPPVWSFQHDYGDSLTFQAGKTWVGKRGQTEWTESIIQNNVRYWWSNLILNQDRTIRAKMTLFYENHLPSNNGKNQAGQGLFYYNRVKLLHEYATGNYKELLKKITLDPAMMIHLDLHLSFVHNWYGLSVSNDKTLIPANENYARELLELYSVGKGLNNNEVLFSEDDVKAVANVLSGWCVCNNTDGSFKRILCKDSVSYDTKFLPELHSKIDKQLSESFNNHKIAFRSGIDGGLLEINELFDILFSRKETSENYVRKLYRFFVYANITPEVEANIIQPLSLSFRTGGDGYKPFDVKYILYQLLSSEHFYHKEQIGCMIKNPFDFAVGLTRMMGVNNYPDTLLQLWSVPGKPVAPDYIAVLAHQQSNYMHGFLTMCGWTLTNVPDVAGLPAYYIAPDYHRLWITANSLRNRKNALFFDNKGVLSGFLTMGKFLGSIPQQEPIIVSFSKSVENYINIDNFIQKNIDYFLVQDLSEKEKDKLEFILTGGNRNVWANSWNAYNTNPSNLGSIYGKLLSFYDNLFSYAEFQLM